MSTTAERADDNLRRIPDGPPPPPRKERRPRWLPYAAALCVVAVALYFGGHWLLYDRHRVYTDDATIDTDQVFVTSKVSERVARVLVDENQFVRRGQPLVVLEDANERAALDLAEQNLRSLQAAANAAHDAASLEGELQAAQVQQQAGSVEAARRTTALSASQAAAASDAVAVAQAQVASARAQLTSVQAAVPAAQDA
jgi:membrane fusion protein (multidrug efflux system)